MNRKTITSSNRKLYKWFISVIGISQGRTTRNLFLLFKTAIISIFIILLIDLLFITTNKESSFGSFGDFFGGVVNPILTFLTFMGLLITIVLQQNELKLTREESRRSADALDKTRQEAELQTRILLMNAQKTDAFNFLNDSRKDLDKILSELSSHSNGDETKWEFIVRVWKNSDNNGEDKFDVGFLESIANGENFHLNKLTKHLELYLVALFELAKLEVNKSIIANYLFIYEKHVKLLIEISYLNPTIYEDLLKHIFKK